MIKFDPNKEKNISFTVDVEGIDPQLLEYKLRLSDGQYEYGFSGEIVNGEVVFCIPPLKDVVKENLSNRLNKIKLEVNDKDDKYYMKPYEDDLMVEAQLKVEAKISETTTEKSTNENIKINASVKENEDKKEKRFKKIFNE